MTYLEAALLWAVPFAGAFAMGVVAGLSLRGGRSAAPAEKVPPPPPGPDLDGELRELVESEKGRRITGRGRKP